MAPLRLSPALLPRIAIVLPLAVMASITMADPDLWGHVRFGEDMLRSGAIRLPDVYSFTSDRPWINHEWLSEIAMALAYRAGGASGLALLRSVLFGAVLGLTWTTVKQHVATDVRRALLMVVAAFGLYSAGATVRPQLFSLLLFTVLLVLLSKSDEQPGLRRWIPLLFLLWVNVHGGWIVGAGVLLLWTLARALRIDRQQRSWWGDVAVGIAAATATLINPYGIGLWRFLLDTVSRARPEISEWQPVSSLPVLDMLPWCGVAALAAWSCARPGAWRDARPVAVVLALGAASWQVQRLTGFFAVATVLLHGRLASGAPVGAFVGTTFGATVQSETPATTPSPSGQPAERWIVAAICVAGLLAAAGAIGQNLSCVAASDSRLADPQAARFIASHGLRGRMLTWFVWGEYAIWHFGPALEVSMDGRRETVYSDQTIAAHLSFYADDAHAQTYLRQLSPDYVWLPTDVPVTASLPKYGWRAVYASPRSMVFARNGAPVVPAADDGATRGPSSRHGSNAEAAMAKADGCFPHDLSAP